MLVLRHGGEEQQGGVWRGLKCDLLNSLGGQRGAQCPTSLTDTPVLLQLELVFKLLMSFEKRNTASFFFFFRAKEKEMEGMKEWKIERSARWRGGWLYVYLFESVRRLEVHSNFSHHSPPPLSFLNLSFSPSAHLSWFHQACHLCLPSSYLNHIHYLPSITSSLSLPSDCYFPSPHAHHCVSLVALLLLPSSPRLLNPHPPTPFFPGPRAPKKSHVFPKWTGWEIEAGLLCLSSHSSVTLLLLPSGGPGKLVTATTTTLQHTCPLFPAYTATHTHTHAHARTHTQHSTLACLVLLLVSGEEVEVGVLSNVQLTHIHTHTDTLTHSYFHPCRHLG